MRKYIAKEINKASKAFGGSSFEDPYDKETNNHEEPTHEGS